MRILALSLLSLVALGCTNSVPEVGYLIDPNIGKTLPAAQGSFVQGDTAAANSTVTATGYKATLMVHAGNNSRVAKTTDNSYQLFIRKTAE